MRQLLCILILLQATAAYAFQTADYEPLHPGDTWNATEDGLSVSYTVSSPANFNGYTASAVTKNNGDITYVTNDANGIRELGYSSSVSIPNYGMTNLTITASPPIVDLPADATLGTTVSSSGTMTLTYSGIGTYTLNYTEQTTPVGFESVTVPAGTFTALKVQQQSTQSGTINGTVFNASISLTTWHAAKVGPIKSVETDTVNGVVTNHTTVVNSYTVFAPVTAPDPFSFAPSSNAVPGSLIESSPITVSGINTASPISVSGGEYSVNHGPYTSSPGTVGNWNNVRVRLRTPMAFGKTSVATLTIGGVSGSFQVSTLPGMPTGDILYYSSEPGDYIGMGIMELMGSFSQYTFSPPSPSATQPMFSIIQSGYSNWWSLSLKMPSGGLLSPGSFENAQRAAFTPSGTPGLDFSGNGRGCNADSGRFDILEASYDPSGNVQKFAINFEQHCEGMAPALFGQLRYNSSIPVDLTLTSGYGEFSPGWNLAGNSKNAAIDVASTFNSPANVLTVWKWEASKTNWAFYTPVKADGGAAYAASKGYDFLTVINPGEGYWVNAINSFTATLPAGAPVTASSFQNMASGWNLVSESGFDTPSAFGSAIGSFVSLWAWDNGSASWFFYAPSLDSAGTLQSYIQSKGYLDFATFGKTLRPGIGFWVNR